MTFSAGKKKGQGEMGLKKNKNQGASHCSSGSH